MLPVLPKLASELQLDQESKRLAALELLGRLLPLPGSDLDLAYPGLFEEFLKRACDQKVSTVRNDKKSSLTICKIRTVYGLPLKDSCCMHKAYKVKILLEDTLEAKHFQR